MITEAIIWAFAHLASFLIGLLPTWTPPSWLDSVVTTLTSAMANVTMLNGWVPIKAIGTMVAFLLACSALAFGLKAGRMVLSVATGGGGSAG